MIDKRKCSFLIIKVLKKNRKKLLEDFKEKNLMIFIPSFKYENNLNAMEISIENYFIHWFNNHFFIWDKEEEKQKCQKQFLEVMYLFLDKYIEITRERKMEMENIDFIIQLLEYKQNIIKEILLLEDKSEMKYNELILEYEKDKALFQRKLKNLT